MPRPAAARSLDEIVREAMDGVVARAASSIAREIARRTAEALEEELSKAARAGAVRRRTPGRRRAPRGGINRWAADQRARRVPTFVIEATGLDTKKAIVARYGFGVVFEKGKPLPKGKG